MLFNSYYYLFYLVVIVSIYYLLPKLKQRIPLLVLASYLFYMKWNTVFALLILASTLIDYFAGIQIQKNESLSKKKLILTVSILLNLLILFYFKYFNFLVENLNWLLSFVGRKVAGNNESLLLPAGISFYTFQSMSYTIDVFRNNVKAKTNFVKYALYVSFFPQLIAGPIERAKNLFPQFDIIQKFDYQNIRTGCFLILLGLFKKIVFADRFALYADEVFNRPGWYSGLTAILGVTFFSFQIYCDFSGYTDIARGSAKLLGYDLMKNFKGPYFSNSIREFWRKWHISLSTWFRDYLYIPLGGNRVSVSKLYRNLLIVFLLTGLWHGANWTYIIWGLFHGFFLVMERLFLKYLPINFPRILRVLYTFIVVSLAWIFFRANSLDEAFEIMSACFLFEKGNLINIFIFSTAVENLEVQISLCLLLVIWVIHLVEYHKDFTKVVLNAAVIPRWLIYTIMIISIPLLGEYGSHKPFIYFQF